MRGLRFLTLPAGILLLAAVEGLLGYDVVHSGRGALHTQAEIAAVAGERVVGIGVVARFVAFNVTPLGWTAYLLILDGVLAWRYGGSPIGLRKHHFWTLFLASVVIWCLFDWINFYFFAPPAWTYLGMPGSRGIAGGFAYRFVGYFISFGTVVPGMLLSGQMLLSSGAMDWARGRRWRMPTWVAGAVLVAGVGMLAYPFVSRSSASNFTLWMSLVLLLDPINMMLGRPSMFRDWQNGWYGRTLAALAGGLICGFLWEFWNYWALTKWVYHLPFLGVTEQYKYFEMPVVGLLGFIPFGMESWVVWQTLRIGLDGLVEELPDEKALL